MAKENKRELAGEPGEARQEARKPRKGIKEVSADLKCRLDSELEAIQARQKRRSAEIMSIFGAHNFYADGLTPVELRTTLEDLGPTYVKIGQIMSSRTDLLPESYCKELEKLRQTVKPLDPQLARAVIEQETGKTIGEIYSEFRDEPLGSASIGQAHYGVLKDGTKVVTKVQRPGIAEMMREDYALLKKLAGALNIITEDSGSDTLDLKVVIEEMEKVSEEELDFRVEAENTRFFKENCIEDEEKISCPTVIDELTTERIFTMTFVDGCSVSKKERLIEEGCDLTALGRAIVDNYIHQILDVGVFHADPHQGNIMVSEGKPYWIDFGMIGRITEGVIEQLCPELDLVELVSAKLTERAKRNFDLKKELLGKGKELLGAGQKLARLPDLIADTLNGLVKGTMKINLGVTGYEEPLDALAQYVKYIITSLLACVLFLGSCILCQVDFEPKTSGGLPASCRGRHRIFHRACDFQREKAVQEIGWRKGAYGLP